MHWVRADDDGRVMTWAPLLYSVKMVVEVVVGVGQVSREEQPEDQNIDLEASLYTETRVRLSLHSILLHHSSNASIVESGEVDLQLTSASAPASGTDGGGGADKGGTAKLRQIAHHPD